MVCFSKKIYDNEIIGFPIPMEYGMLLSLKVKFSDQSRAEDQILIQIQKNLEFGKNVTYIV